MIYDLAFGAKKRLSIDFQDGLDELPSGESISGTVSTIFVDDGDLVVTDFAPTGAIASYDVDAASVTKRRLYKVKNVATTTPGDFKIPRTNFFHVMRHVPTVSTV